MTLNDITYTRQTTTVNMFMHEDEFTWKIYWRLHSNLLPLIARAYMTIKLDTFFSPQKIKNQNIEIVNSKWIFIVENRQVWLFIPYLVLIIGLGILLALRDNYCFHRLFNIQTPKSANVLNQWNLKTEKWIKNYNKM